jgi:hypothetical protein
VRNRVSTMTAALVEIVLLDKVLGLGVDCPSPAAEGCGEGTLVAMDSACCEYMLRIVLWGKHSLIVHIKMRIRKAERMTFRDLRRRSSIMLLNAVLKGLPNHGVLICFVELNTGSLSRRISPPSNPKPSSRER